jgi:hypothetical protein
VEEVVEGQQRQNDGNGDGPDKGGNGHGAQLP